MKVKEDKSIQHLECQDPLSHPELFVPSTYVWTHDTPLINGIGI